VKGTLSMSSCRMTKSIAHGIASLHCSVYWVICLPKYKAGSGASQTTSNDWGGEKQLLETAEIAVNIPEASRAMEHDDISVYWCRRSWKFQSKVTKWNCATNLSISGLWVVWPAVYCLTNERVKMPEMCRANLHSCN
jgi:hypothetical protein